MQEGPAEGAYNKVGWKTEDLRLLLLCLHIIYLLICMLLLLVITLLLYVLMIEDWSSKSHWRLDDTVFQQLLAVAPAANQKLSLKMHQNKSSESSRVQHDFGPRLIGQIGFCVSKGFFKLYSTVKQ